MRLLDEGMQNTKMDKREFIDRRVLAYNTEFNILAKTIGDVTNIC